MKRTNHVDTYIENQLATSKKTAAETASTWLAISRNATAMSLPFITGANVMRQTEVISDTSANVVTIIGAIGLLGSGVMYLKGRRAQRRQQQLESLQQNMQPAEIATQPEASGEITQRLPVLAVEADPVPTALPSGSEAAPSSLDQQEQLVPTTAAQQYHTHA